MLANQYVQYGKVQSMLVRDNTAMQCVENYCTVLQCSNVAVCDALPIVNI